MQLVLESLRSFPVQLERFFEAVPKEFINWEPENWDGVPSESLTALGQICHIRDIEIDGYQVRFRRILEEENPILRSIDGYALVEERNYAAADPVEIFHVIRQARQKTIEMIGDLTPAQLARPGYFEGYGRITVKSLVHFLCSHDQQHLAGIQWLLGKIEAEAQFESESVNPL